MAVGHNTQHFRHSLRPEDELVTLDPVVIGRPDPVLGPLESPPPIGPMIPMAYVQDYLRRQRQNRATESGQQNRDNGDRKEQK